jgi:phosphonopyruvate decarboxylase
LATGHYLATGGIPLVYMQNSGLGNVVNPLTSLTPAEVYGIPMLVLIGWRGEPGKKDEPQHVKMGGVTCALLDAVGVDWAVLPDDIDSAKTLIETAVSRARESSAPYAIVVRKGTFGGYKLQGERPAPYDMSRERALEVIVAAAPADTLIVTTTGKPSRELFYARERRGEAHDTDFLTVGSMGHSSQIALGVALGRPDRSVLCIDGDGAAIMHMGGFSTIGSLGPGNYRHLLLNNGAHDSVGGQPTVGFEIDFCQIATACGYRSAHRVSSEEALASALPAFFESGGPVLLEVRVKVGARADLGRPTMTPQELKVAFMGATRS